MPSILDPERNLTLRPMQYPEFFEMFETSYLKNNWTVQEISFATDTMDIKEKLTDAQRHLVNRLVAFFATGDSVVSENCALTIYRHVNSPEFRMYLGRQIFEEALHVAFYLELLDQYLPDPDDRVAAFAAVENIPSIKRKADFCFKYMDQMNTIPKLLTDDDRRTFLLNMTTFACAVEGMFFFASFAVVFYLRDQGLLHGLASGTNWVFRDESQHLRASLAIVDIVKKESPHLWDHQMVEMVKQMLREAIECELQFADDALSMGVIGLSRDDMHEYLRYVADGHCLRLGIEPMFNAKCPFAFMLAQDVQSLTNFFERTTTEYSVGISGEVSLDEDF